MMTDEYLQFETITASSSKEECPCTPDNVVMVEDSSTFWSPEDDDEKPYVEMRFNEIVALTEMTIKGAVPEFMISTQYCNVCGPKFISSLEKDEEGNLEPQPKIFNGNDDEEDEEKTIRLFNVMAAMIRIYPVRSEPGTPISVQVDFKGCRVGPTSAPITTTTAGSTTTVMPGTTTTSETGVETTVISTTGSIPVGTTTSKVIELTTDATKTTTPGVCAEPMLSEERVPIKSITSSSSKEPSSPTDVIISPEDSDEPSSWQPEDEDEEPYIEVEFEELVIVTKIVTKGGENGEFVPEFKIKTSLTKEDEPVFLHTFEPETKTQIPNVYEGNDDDTTEVVTSLTIPAPATVIRIYPVRAEPNTPVSLQVDILGCFMFTPETTKGVETTTKVGMTTPSVSETTAVSTTSSSAVETTTPASGTTTSSSVESTTPKSGMTTMPVDTTTTSPKQTTISTIFTTSFGRTHLVTGTPHGKYFNFIN